MSSCYSKLHFMLQLATLTDILTLNFQKFCIPYYKITETFYYFLPSLRLILVEMIALVNIAYSPTAGICFMPLSFFSAYFALQDNTPQEILLRNLKSPQPDFLYYLFQKPYFTDPVLHSSLATLSP